MTRVVPTAVLCFFALFHFGALFAGPAGAAARGQGPGKSAEFRSVEPAARGETILVLPFGNASRHPRLDWLGEGLAELTIERLAGSGRAVFPREEWQAALEKLGLPASPRLSRATMLKIAEETDADYVVFGQYGYDGKTLQVTARVLRANPPALAQPLEEAGALEDLMDTHARIAWHVLRFIEPGFPLGQREFAQKLPRLRLDAFEHFVRGLLAAEPENEAQRLRLLREAARLEPEWADPAFALGQTYLARRDCEAALPWFSRVPPAHERGAEASFSAGVCHLLRDDPARAEAAFASLVERTKQTGKGPGAVAGGAEGCCAMPEALNNLAIARARLGKLREARADLQRATQLDPEEVDYWFNLGLAALRANDPASAVRPFREVLRRQPEDAEARTLLIAALERSGRGAEAAAERRETARPEAEAAPRKSTKSPTKAGTHAAGPSLQPEALGRLDRIKMRVDVSSLHHLAEGAEPTPAEATVTAARRSQHREMHLARGRQALTEGKLDEAFRDFSAAVLLAPMNPAAHQGLAEVFRRQGRPGEAIRELRSAAALRDDAATRILLGRLCLEQNSLSEAREELRAALKLDPASAEARQLLEQLEARLAAGEPR